MLVLILVAAALVLTVVVAARRRRSVLQRLTAQVQSVDQQVRTWQHAHDHHVAELHRRLAGIEGSAQRAADQGRAVSGDLSELNASLLAHLGTFGPRRSDQDPRRGIRP